MAAHTMSQMQSGFGADFSQVRIHTDSNAVQLSKDLGAQAFTHGNDIYFNEGKYNPSSTSGQHLLAHELTHTIQQGGSASMAQNKIQRWPAWADSAVSWVADTATSAASSVAEGAAWVWCGDYSLDRGTGSVPAFLAAALGAQQALGVIDVQFAAPGPAARVTRRLDGGRREVLDVTGPAVVSVEGAVADLRRAGLGALRVATSASIDVVPLRSPARRLKAVVQPYRPRAMALAAPDGSPLERLRLLTDAAAATAARGETVTLAPPDAAARIVAALRGWGYLDS